MAIEIEKKFLVFKNKLPKLTGGVLFIQGYLSKEPLIRFRIAGNKKTSIAIKEVKKEGLARNEWEFHNVLSQEENEKLLKLAINKPIKKIRFKRKFKGLLWEIDVYQGKNLGLVTADVEIPHEEFKIEFPKWIDYSKEITSEAEYFNINLGKNPFKK